MSFVFRGGPRGDIESGFHGFIPERRAVRFHGGGRPINTNPMVIFITMFLLFMVLSSHQVSPNFLANAAAVAASGIFGQTELRLRMPPIAFATRGRLHGLRLQLALLDREFDELDYDALRALDPDNPPGVPALSEAEINSLPVHKYRAKNPSENSGSSAQQQSAAVFTDGLKNNKEGSSSAQQQEGELTCSVCLEQVSEGEIIRTLPCLHQFHPPCIDQWLRQQATCPVCKFKISSD